MLATSAVVLTALPPANHVGGNGTAPTPGGGASVQFVAFVTPPHATETVLQVLNPTSEPQRVAVAAAGELGFEYTLPPGLATFAWK